MSLLSRESHKPGHARAPIMQRARKILSGAAVKSELSQDTPVPKTIAAPELEVSSKTGVRFIKGASIDLSQSQPLLTAEQVRAQYGVELGLGDLTAVIKLPVPEAWGHAEGPVKPKLAYCFTEGFGGKHAGGEVKAVHHIMGQRSLNALYTAAVTNERPDESAMHDALTLSQGGSEELRIGREKGWLPELGYDTQVLDSDQAIAHEFAAISRNHATVSVDAMGGLHITDPGSFNGTYVYSGITPGAAGQSPATITPSQA